MGNEIYMDNDLIFITVSKYELFLSYDKVGIDAYILYSHLIYTARLQKTNSIWANNKYLRQGLNWGKDRLQNAKNLLTELDIIKEKQGKDENGKFTKKYIIVKTRTVPLEPVSSEPDNGPAGTPNQETNALTKKEMLKQKKEMLIKKNKKYEHLSEFFDLKLIENSKGIKKIKQKNYNKWNNIFYEFVEKNELSENRIKNIIIYIFKSGWKNYIDTPYGMKNHIIKLNNQLNDDMEKENEKNY